MAALHSYELKGNKLSFANWISNLSPTETPFCSMTGKEATDQTIFFWQTDRLAPAANNFQIEGSDVEYSPDTTAATSTKVESNFTQILRRSFKVSDTANALANYGRGREVSYQMEKYSQALKRDLEAILLSDQLGAAGTTNNVRKTTGFPRLVKTSATDQDVDSDTGAKTYLKTGAAPGSDTALTKKHVQTMTYNLYLAGSEASVIMFHPRHAAFWAGLQGSQGTLKMFDGDETTFSHYVNTYVDEYGRSYKLVPNRLMPESMVYFFKPEDVTQMILRAPMKTELAKKGNYQHWMIEMEVGLRLRDRYAAGVLEMKV